MFGDNMKQPLRTRSVSDGLDSEFDTQPNLDDVSGLARCSRSGFAGAFNAAIYIKTLGAASHLASRDLHPECIMHPVRLFPLTLERRC